MNPLSGTGGLTRISAGTFREKSGGGMTAALLARL
jgi:hypothetical protein